MGKYKHHKVFWIIAAVIGNAILLWFILSAFKDWPKAIDASGDILLGGFGLFGVIMSVVVLNMIIERCNRIDEDK